MCWVGSRLQFSGYAPNEQPNEKSHLAWDFVAQNSNINVIYMPSTEIFITDVSAEANALITLAPFTNPDGQSRDLFRKGHGFDWNPRANEKCSYGRLLNRVAGHPEWKDGDRLVMAGISYRCFLDLIPTAAVQSAFDASFGCLLKTTEYVNGESAPGPCKLGYSIFSTL